jgi:hypothetical protein
MSDVTWTFFWLYTITSCETQLVSFIQELAKNNNHNIQTDIIVMDFAKAFDKVPHKRLLFCIWYCHDSSANNLQSDVFDVFIEVICIHKEQNRTQNCSLGNARCYMFIQELAKNNNHNIQTDIIVMDFAKAFDKVPHKRLLSKLNYYSIEYNTLKWIEDFLFLIVLYMILSSANNLRVLCLMYSLKLFIYTRNRIGPKTVHWGTSDGTGSCHSIQTSPQSFK